MILYLHGFRSSPLSAKVRLLAESMAANGLGARFWCRQLPVSPQRAIEQVEDAIVRAPVVPPLVGSSLGGYYATYLAEKHRLRAVLINPAVVAHLSLARYVGPQTNPYTGESFEFTLGHIAELARLLEPARFWLLVETGDEVLDYRQAVAKYAGARQTVIQGGNHGFQHFPELLDAIIAFAGLRPVPGSPAAAE